MMATIPLTGNSTNIYSSTSNTNNFPQTNPSKGTLTLLVAGISTPLLVVALAVVIIIIIVVVWIKRQTSTNKGQNSNQDTEQQDGLYATLTRQEHPDITLNHPMDVLYAVVDMDNQGEGRDEVNLDKQIIESPPNSEEKKRQIALEDLYAVVNKQHKKKQFENKDAPPAQSNTVDGVYYNTAAIRKGHAIEDEEIVPQIPPHTIESDIQQL